MIEMGFRVLRIKLVVVWFLVANLYGTLFAVAVFNGGFWVWTMIIMPTLLIAMSKQKRSQTC